MAMNVREFKFKLRLVCQVALGHVMPQFPILFFFYLPYVVIIIKYKLVNVLSTPGVRCGSFSALEMFDGDSFTESYVAPWTPR